MSGYDLIAFDMDGTLLTSKNKVSESSREAIARAVELGKRIAVCTGRAVGEIEPYEENELQNVRYFVCENGALLYDSETKEILSSTVIPDEIVEKIIDIIDGEDCMLVGYSKGRNLVDSIDAERMDYFYVTRYKELQRKTGKHYDGLYDAYRKEHFPMEKMNVYASSVEIRDRLFEQIIQLPVTVVYAEDTGFEISPLHMSKGIGLKQLCEIVKIPLEHTIAVGDSDNDVKMMKVAGLPVAMGNARECVREVCKVSVADTDHGGCAEAIYRYLLGGQKE